MIRVYREFLQKVLVVLAYIKVRQGNGNPAPSFDEMSGLVRDRMGTYPDGVDPEQVQVATYRMQLGKAESGLDDTIDEMMAMVSKQLKEAQDGSNEGNYSDLIDTLVTVLQLPYARNTLSGKTMQSLKKALLLPSELNGIKETLKKKERHCAGCGHKFVSSEVATITTGEQDEGLLMCIKCIIPTYIRCSGCDKVVALSDKDRKFFTRKFDCGTHSTPAGVEQGGEEVVHPAGYEPTTGGGTAGTWGGVIRTMEPAPFTIDPTPPPTGNGPTRDGIFRYVEQLTQDRRNMEEAAANTPRPAGRQVVFTSRRRG